MSEQEMETRRAVRCEETAHGFVFGAAKVTRMSYDPNNASVWIGVTTAKYPYGIQIYVTRTGKVRIFSDDAEWRT